MADDNKVAAWANLNASSGVSSDTAAQALRVGPQANLPPAVAMQTPELADSWARQNEQQGAIDSSPHVANWAATGSPAAVAATKDNFSGLAKVGDMLSNFAPGSFGDLAKSIGTDTWKTLQQSLQRSPLGIVQQGAKAGGEAFNLYADTAAALLGYAKSPEGSYRAKMTPQERFQSDKDLASMFLMPNLPIPGLGEAGEAKSAAGFASPTAPLAEPPMPGGDGRYPVSPEGFVTDPAGNPVHFGNQRAAGEWYTKQAYPTGTDQIFETANAPGDTGTFHVRETGFTAPPVEDVPDVGVHPGVDAARRVVADADAEAVTQLQNTIADEGLAEKSKEATQEFLEQQTQGKTVSIDATALHEAMSTDPKFGQDVLGLFEDQAEFDGFLDAVHSGDDHQMPLSQYLANTAGQPWAEKVNAITNFREGGVSQAQAKDVTAATNPGPTLPAFNVDNHPDLDPYEKEVLQTHAAAFTQAANSVAKELYLNSLFEDGKAVGLTKSEFEAYSNRIQNAHQAIYDKLVEKARVAIKRQRTEEWQNAYSQNFHGALTDIMRRPDIRAAYALKYGTEEAAAKNVLKNPDGTPVTFYHGTNYPNITKWEVPKFSSHHGISFAEHGPFAGNWALGKGIIAGAEKYPTTYITHIMSSPDKIGDFRKPADVEKAVKWYMKNRPSKFISEYSTESSVRASLKSGAWPMWEYGPFIKAMGWDGVRMHESANSPMEYLPNIFILDGDKVLFKFKDSGGITQKIALSPDTKLQYDGSLLADLPKGIFEKGGKSADEVAEQFGYFNGRDMLEDIAKLNKDAKASGQSIKNYIMSQANDLAFKNAENQLGWKLDPESILNAALDNVDMPTALDVLADELKKLSNSIALPFDRATVEAVAAERFDQLTTKAARNIKQLQNYVYRGGIKTERALIKGDYPKAFLAKQNQFMHMVMLQEAFKFEKFFDKASAKMDHWAKGKFSATIEPELRAVIEQGLSDLNYSLGRNKVELQRYLAQSSIPDLDAGVNFANSAAGMMLTRERVSPEVISQAMRGGVNGTLVPLMSVDDFHDYFDMLNGLHKLGTELGQLISSGKTMKLNDLAVGVQVNANEIGRKFTPQQLYDMRGSKFGEYRNSVKTLLVMNLRPEVYLHWIDGNKNGLLMNAAVEPLMEGKYQETDLVDQWSKAMKAADTSGKMFRSMKEEIVAPDHMTIQTQSGPVVPIKTRGQLRVALLHLGSVSARMKMLRGFGWGDEAEKWMLETSTPQDWEFVNSFWEQNEKLFDLSDKMWMRVRGYGLKKDVLREVVTPHGTFPGGYVHMRYNATLANEMALDNPQQVVPSAPADLLGTHPITKLPSASYRMQRTSYVGPVDLNPNTLMAAVSEVIHDISFREALGQAQKVLNHPLVAEALESVLGPEYKNQINPWLMYIAEERVLYDASTDAAARIIQGISNNMAFAYTAMNLHSVLTHSGIGAMHMATELGGRADIFAAAANDLIGTGPKAQAWRDFVSENSSEVRQLHWNVDSNIHDIMTTTLGKDSAEVAYKKFAMGLFTLSKVMEANVTWLAKYRIAMGEVGSHDEAVRVANKAVRDTQGAGSSVDLSPVLRRGHGWAGALGRWITGTLMGFRNTAPNRIFTAKRLLGLAGKLAADGDAAGAAKASGQAMGMLAGFILFAAGYKALSDTFLVGHRDKDKRGKDKSAIDTFEEEFMWGLAEQTAGSMSGGSLIVDSAHYQQSGGTGDMASDYVNSIIKSADISSPHWLFNALTALGEITGKLPISIAHVAEAAYDQFNPRLADKERNTTAAAQRVILGRTPAYTPKRNFGGSRRR